MAGMVFSNAVTTITYQEIMPSIVDDINNSNIFLGMVLSRPGNWKGVVEYQPIKNANSTTGGFFSGMDTFPVAATNNTQSMSWYVAAYEQSVVVPGIEQAVNSQNDKQVLRLLTTKLDEGKISAMQTIGQSFYGIGSGKAFDGLGLIVDNGTNTSSYAGIVRATSPFINGDVTSVTSGIVTLDYLSSEFDNVSAAGSLSESPTVGLTTKADWTLIEGAMQPMVAARYEAMDMKGYDRMSGGIPNSTETPSARIVLAGGANSLVYRGRNIVADDNCTAGTFFWINERYLAFKRLVDNTLKQIPSTVEVTEGVYKDTPMPSAFQFREMMSPVQQYGEVGLLILMGQLEHRQPRRNGKLIGITAN